MAKQMGSAANFSKMNAIQQEALAKAVGMSADELANSLVARENLNKLGSQTKQQIEEQLELAKQQGDQDKVNLLQKSLGNEELAEEALRQISAQETFNTSVEKLKSMLSSLVEGPAAKFVDGLGNMLSSVDRIKSAFGGIMKIITGISLGKMIGQLGIAAGLQSILAAGAITWASGITLGVGIAAVLGGMLVASSGYKDITKSMEPPKKMNDGIINPKGGMILSGPEGSIQLNKKDSVIAGTNLGGGGGNSSAEITELKNMVAAIANRPINISIDGQKVIEATTGANPNTDGDAMRKNSYKIS
jgi:hypothetical protein